MPTDPRDEFIQAALWHGRLDDAEAVLAAHLEIASSDIFTAAILGDDAAIRRFLQSDPALATAKGGPRNWDALTYLCFSKYLRLRPERSEAFVRAATALLDAGASARTGFFDESHKPAPTFESALYAAAGVAHHPELTKLLLERGADPNDDEVPYHAPETLDNRALMVLVESGKLTPASLGLMLLRKFNWHNDDGVVYLLDHGADPNLAFARRRPLYFALTSGNPLRYFEWLLDHGADPSLPNDDGTSIFKVAARLARADVLELFESRGFHHNLTGDDAFLAACARANATAARQIAAADPGMVQRLQTENPGLLVDFAGSGNAAAVTLMLDLGFDPGASRTQPEWVRGETALHAVAGRGHLDVARRLIERGAPIEAERKGLTPLSVALRSLVEQSEFTPNEYTLPIAHLLLESGARMQPGELTLTGAVCLGRWDDAERLAKNATRVDLQIALAAAAFNGLIDGMKFLIGLGADINAYNEGPNPFATPLHNAVNSGSLAAVRLLVEAGAKIDARDKSWQATPLDWAQYFGQAKEYPQIVAYLRER